MISCVDLSILESDLPSRLAGTEADWEKELVVMTQVVKLCNRCEKTWNAEHSFSDATYPLREVRHAHPKWHMSHWQILQFVYHF